MADSNPFAHLGMGMLGADVGIAKAAATPQPLFKNNPMAGLIGMGLDKLGVKDWLNALGGGEGQTEQQPEGAVAPPSVAGTGINPVSMGAAIPPGSETVGLGMQNKAPIEGIQPKPFTYQGFGGQGGYALPQSPYQVTQPQQAGDTKNQIRSAWGY